MGQVTDADVFDGQNITVTRMTELIVQPTSSSLSGTRNYLAPELLEGRPLTTLADIYALGMLLFQMAVGDFQQTLGVGWQRHVADDLLAEDIAACVDHDPDRRLNSAADLALRLRSLEARRARRLAETEEKRLAEETAARLAKSRRQRRILTAFSALTVMFLLVVSILALFANKLRRDAIISQQETVAVNRRLEYDLYVNSIQRALQLVWDESQGQAAELLHQQPLTHRHFEWGYLLRLCHPELLDIDLGQPITGLSAYGYSPRKTWFLIGSRWEMRIFDARTGDLVHTIALDQTDMGFTNIFSYAFTSDETHLFIGTSHSMIGVFNTRTWQFQSAFTLPFPAWTLAVCRQDTRILAFESPAQNVNALAVCLLSLDRENLQNPIALVAEMHSALRPFNTLALSPDERLLALPSKPLDAGDRPFQGIWRDIMSGVARDPMRQGFGFEIRDLETGQITRRLGDFEQIVTALRFLPDGRRIICGARDQSVTIWDVESGALVQQCAPIPNGANDIVPGTAESVAIALGMQGSLDSFDTRTGRPLRSSIDKVANTRNYLWGRLYPDDDSILVVERSATTPHFYLSRIRAEQTLHTQPTLMPPDALRLNDYLNHQSLLTVGQSAKQVSIVNMFPESEQTTWEVTPTTPSALFFSPDTALAAFPIAPGVLGLLDVDRTQELATVFRGHHDTIIDVDFSPDNRRMVTASTDMTIRLWDVQTGRELLCHYVNRVLSAEPSRIRFSPDGRAIAIGYSNGTAELFDSFPWDVGYATSASDAETGAIKAPPVQKERYATWLAEREDMPHGVMHPHRAQAIRDMLERPRPRPTRLTRQLAKKWWDICKSDAFNRTGSEWERSLMLYEVMAALQTSLEADDPIWADLYEKIDLAHSQHLDYFLAESVQSNPEWELPPDHPNHPGRQALRSRASSQTERCILGHWDFARHDLSATIGQDLAIHDAESTPRALQEIRFGPATAFGLPEIDGASPDVMDYPAFSPDEGITMPLDFVGNGGGVFLNQYTLIMDLYVPEHNPPTERSLLQTYHRFLLNGELSIGPTGGIGIQRQRFGRLTMDGWNRIALSVDLTRNPLEPNFITSINGQRVGEQIVIDRPLIDGRFALRPINLLLTGKAGETAPGALSSVQVRNYAMNGAEIAALGGPSAKGIATDLTFGPAAEAPWSEATDYQRFRQFVEASSSMYPHERLPLYLQALEHLATRPGMNDATVQLAANSVRDSIGPYHNTQDNPLYNIRLLNPGLELPTDHPNKMPPPDHTRAPGNAPDPAILGYWDFAQADLSARTGQALEFFDPNQTGGARQKARFGLTSALGVPDIPGAASPVVAIPAFLADEGIVMPLAFAPNGGGYFLNQYTILMDVCLPASSAGQTITLLHTHHKHSLQSEFYIDARGGIGASPPFYGALSPGVWHRIGIVVDLTRPPDRRTPVEDGNVRHYIDGRLAGQESLCRAIPAIDSNYALRPINLLFTDSRSGFRAPLVVGAIQVRNYPMSADEIALLARPSADGIATDLRLDLNRHFAAP